MPNHGTAHPRLGPVREIVTIPLERGTATLVGDLSIPSDAVGLVVFAHGSGSGRLSPRNRCVAEALHRAGFATLLFDLLTPDEQTSHAVSGHLRFDIPLLSNRLAGVTEWLRRRAGTRDLPMGYFGASTGAAAALVAAAGHPKWIRAIVSRGGRPDLAAGSLPQVRVPTLLIVGGNDAQVIGMNHLALQRLGAAPRQLIMIPGATHLFEEAGALERVADLACRWFTRYLADSIGEERAG